MPEVSIAICFRNPGPKVFELAIKSIFAQTFQDWELILLNDISNDGSLEFAQSLKDERVRVFNDGEGKGFNVRLNEMVKLSRGKYFFRMDADDVMHPQRVQRQLEFLRKADEQTVVGSASYSIDTASQVVGFRPGQPRQRQGFAARKSFIHPTVAAHTRWFLKNPYSESYIYRRAEDAELWCRTTATSTFAVLPEPLMFYREGSSSFTAYIETEMVFIHILRERFSKPLPAYLKAVNAELGKLWVACLLEAFGKSGLHYRRRYSPLAPEKLAEAKQILNVVIRTELPVSTAQRF